jgi:hypothetical protein
MPKTASAKTTARTTPYQTRSKTLADAVCNYGVCSSDVSLVCWVCDDKHGNEKRFCCLECLEGWQALHGDWD